YSPAAARLVQEEMGRRVQTADRLKKEAKEARVEAERLDEERQDGLVTGWEQRVAGGEKTSTIMQEADATIASGDISADKVREMGKTLDSIVKTRESVAGREARVSRAVVDDLDVMGAIWSAMQQTPTPDKNTMAFIKLAQENDKITDQTALSLQREYFARKRASLESGLSESDKAEWRNYRQVEKYLQGLMKVSVGPGGFFKTAPGVDLAKVAQAMRKLFEKAWLDRANISKDITPFMVADNIAALYGQGAPAPPGGLPRPGIPGTEGQKSKAERIAEGIYGQSGVSPERVREINKELNEFLEGRGKQ
ncbi:hypothetical protein LCGC14_1108910, partial [marine sediment metagenome]